MPEWQCEISNKSANFDERPSAIFDDTLIYNPEMSADVSAGVPRYMQLVAQSLGHRDPESIHIFVRRNAGEFWVKRRAGLLIQRQKMPSSFSPFSCSITVLNVAY
jgi:hypothetical protein